VLLHTALAFEYSNRPAGPRIEQACQQVADPVRHEPARNGDGRNRLALLAMVGRKFDSSGMLKPEGPQLFMPTGLTPSSRDVWDWNGLGPSRSSVLNLHTVPADISLKALQPAIEDNCRD
jgi:hypothetical protein